MTISSPRAVRAVALPLLAATALALAACGSSGSGSSTQSTAAASGGSTSTSSSSSSSSSSGTLALTAQESSGLSFDKSALTAKAGSVTLKMANPSGNSAQHGVAVEGNGVDKAGQVVGPGSTSTVSLNLTPGKYTFYCPVPGHRAAGMVGTLTVS